MKNKRLEFYSLLDFYPRKENIKKEYKKMSVKSREIYKMYVYSLCFETEYIKDLIWEYLNDWKESQDELKKQYISKLKKVGKNK